MIPAAKQSKRVEEEKKMNPVQLIVRLPRDLRAYVKTFLIGVRYPLIFRVEGACDDTDGSTWDVEQWSIRGVPGGNFLCLPDNTPDFPLEGPSNDWRNRARAAITLDPYATIALIANEFVRPRTCRWSGSDNGINHNVLTIESRCCAKHEVGIVMRSDWDDIDSPVLAGHPLGRGMADTHTNRYMGDVPLAYGGERNPQTQPFRLLTFFGQRLNRLPAARQLVERVLTRFSHCSDNPYDCVDDAFDLEDDEADDIGNDDDVDSGDEDDNDNDDSDEDSDDDVPPPLVEEDSDEDEYAEYADLTSCYPMQV